MAITTLAGAISGMTMPIDIQKTASGTLVAGRPFSFLNIGAYPPACGYAASGGSAANALPFTYPITNISVANPTVITVTNMPWANNDIISIQGTGSTPSCDGRWTISNVSGSTFTIPVNVVAFGVVGYAAGWVSAGGSGLDGKALTSMLGCLPYLNSANTYLARLQANNQAQTGTLCLCDRLWHNAGYSPLITTIQPASATGTNVQIPSRDANGSNAGVGVYAALEAYSNLGSGAATPLLTYTDQSGNTGHTANLAVPWTASPIAGNFHPFALASGDTGVRSVTGVTLGTGVSSGAFGIVLYRPIAQLEINNNTTINTNAIDALTACLPRIYDNSCLFFVFRPTTTTTTGFSAQVILTQG